MDRAFWLSFNTINKILFCIVNASWGMSVTNFLRNQKRPYQNDSSTIMFFLINITLSVNCFVTRFKNGTLFQRPLVAKSSMNE